MDVLIVIFTVFLFLILIHKIKPRLDKIFYILLGTLFCGLLIISLFNPYKLFDVSDYTYLILLLGFGSFLIGYTTNQNRIKYRFSQHTYDTSCLLFLRNNHFFWIIFILAFVTIIYMAITQWKLIVFQGGLGRLKLDFFELIFNNNSVLYFFYQVVIFPLFHFAAIIFSYLAMNNGNRKYIIIFLAYSILFAFVGGKRGYFATIFEYYVIVFVITKISQGFGLLRIIKSSYKLIVLAVFVYISAAFMTSLSGGDYTSTEKLKEAGAENAKNLIIYNIGPYRALDYALNNDYLKKAGGFQFGRATLGGTIDYYGAGILKRMGFQIQPVRANTMNILQNNSIDIGNETTFNFAYTAFMYFYFDFGLVGIILFSFIFGWFLRYSVRLYTADKTLGSLGLTCFLFLSSVQLPGNWFNIALSTQPTLLLFYYIRKKELKYAK